MSSVPQKMCLLRSLLVSIKIKQLDVGVSPPAFSFTLIVTLTRDARSVYAVSYYTFWDMNYYLVWILFQSQTDGWKAMHMSPPCIFLRETPSMSFDFFNQIMSVNKNRKLWSAEKICLHVTENDLLWKFRHNHCQFLSPSTYIKAKDNWFPTWIKSIFPVM